MNDKNKVPAWAVLFWFILLGSSAIYCYCSKNYPALVVTLFLLIPVVLYDENGSEDDTDPPPGMW